MHLQNDRPHTTNERFSRKKARAAADQRRQHMMMIIILIIRIMRMNCKIQIENCFICHPSRSHFESQTTLISYKRSAITAVEQSGCTNGNVSFMHSPLMKTLYLVVIAMHSTDFYLTANENWFAFNFNFFFK